MQNQIKALIRYFIIVYLLILNMYYQEKNVYQFMIVISLVMVIINAGRGTLQHTTVSDCGIAIRANWEGLTITYNNIINSDIGIIAGSYSGSTPRVYGNNFINNTVNIESPGSIDQDRYSYNYWGTDDETEIANKIEDICDGYSTSLVTWWPYIIQAIDFKTDITSNNTIDPSITSNLQSTLTCGSTTNETITNGTILSSLYLGSTILIIANSPYYVVSDIVFQSTLTIEAGVMVIFTGDYTFEIRDEMDSCPYPDQITAVKGIYDQSTAITFTSNNGSSGYILIDTDNDATGKFCNVHFEKMRFAIAVTCCGGYSESVTIYNAYFNDIDYIFSGYSGSDIKIYNSIFNNFIYAASSADKIFYNCLFTNFENVLSRTERVSIYDSDIIGNGNNTCLNAGRGVIKNSTINNCNIGIKPIY